MTATVRGCIKQPSEKLLHLSWSSVSDCSEIQPTGSVPLFDVDLLSPGLDCSQLLTFTHFYKVHQGPHTKFFNVGHVKYDHCCVMQCRTVNFYGTTLKLCNCSRCSAVIQPNMLEIHNSVEHNY